MKANELRIGNFFYDDISKSFCSIKNINHDGWISLFVLKDGETITEKLPIVDNISKIPINKENLIKFGFIELKKHGYYDYYFTQYGAFKFDADETSSCVYIKYNDIVIAYCEYIHELQNLYFALTKKELELQ